MTSQPVAQLTATHVSRSDEEGYCGNFQRVRQWGVTNPVEGVIVQRVTRAFAVSKVNQSALMSGSELNGYVRGQGSTVNGNDTDYYELWTVDSRGRVSDGGDDTFGLCSIIPGDVSTIKNSTKGTFTMTGSATFYPSRTDATTLQGYGFRKRAVVSAGGLYSMTGSPRSLPQSAGVAVTYAVTSAWDSTNVDEPWSTVT